MRVKPAHSPLPTHFLTSGSRKITSLVRCAAASFSAYFSVFETANANPPEGFSLRPPGGRQETSFLQAMLLALTVVASGGSPSPPATSRSHPLPPAAPTTEKPSERVLLSFTRTEGFLCASSAPYRPLPPPPPATTCRRHRPLPPRPIGRLGLRGRSLLWSLGILPFTRAGARTHDVRPARSPASALFAHRRLVRPLTSDPCADASFARQCLILLPNTTR